ncbi:unnamed protein product [Durusdinium trenchii]|uniref:Uncharacterized protein n=1 Tax=Durusdinium trenchii TaxID=1381693 RepID=A0ABP0H4V1_9DINO
MASDEYAELFAEDPEAFLQVPLPPNLPRLLDDAERARKADVKTELKDFCPVALVETGELVKAAMKFMRQPMRYRTAKLPPKLPPEACVLGHSFWLENTRFREVFVLTSHARWACLPADGKI